MQIEITIDGEKKTFVTEQVTMLARRKFLEIQASEEAILEERGTIPTNEVIKHENEMINILANIVFKGQFTSDELMAGVTDEYFNKKLTEAVFGIKKEDDEGNEKGKQ